MKSLETIGNLIVVEKPLAKEVMPTMDRFSQKIVNVIEEYEYIVRNVARGNVGMQIFTYLM